MPSPPDRRFAENLRRWTASGQPRRWVEAQCGGWGRADWFVLLANLRHSEFWPMNPRDVRAVLARLHREKQERDNLRRWLASGRAGLWVQAHQGRWGPDDGLALLAELRASAFWPVQPGAVQLALEEVRTEWRNLRRWQESGQPRRWVEARGGRWEHRDWLALLAELCRSDFWPLEAAAVGRVLQAVKDEMPPLHPPAAVEAIGPAPRLVPDGGLAA